MIVSFGFFFSTLCKMRRRNFFFVCDLKSVPIKLRFNEEEVRSKISFSLDLARVDFSRVLVFFLK